MLFLVNRIVLGYSHTHLPMVYSQTVMVVEELRRELYDPKAYSCYLASYTKRLLFYGSGDSHLRLLKHMDHNKVWGKVLYLCVTHAKKLNLCSITPHIFHVPWKLIHHILVKV